MLEEHDASLNEQENPKQLELKIGMTFTNNQGCVGEVVDFKNKKEVYVIFEGCLYPIKCEFGNIRKGEVKNPFFPKTCGVGYIGQGDYKPVVNGVDTKTYKLWCGVMTRCYSEKYQAKHKTYVGCEVEEHFHNYQNFAKWYEENYYEVDGERMHLDKDILRKGNKIYGVDTCVFVPSKINLLFTKTNVSRGGYPIGVSLKRETGKYSATCNYKGKGKILGYFDTPEEAFKVYKEFKEQYIKEVADEYKDMIPKKLYDAMYSYEVEITD